VVGPFHRGRRGLRPEALGDVATADHPKRSGCGCPIVLTWLAVKEVLDAVFTETSVLMSDIEKASLASLDLGDCSAPTTPVADSAKLLVETSSVIPEFLAHYIPLEGRRSHTSRIGPVPIRFNQFPPGTIRSAPPRL
jgi:hypothetical protein